MNYEVTYLLFGKSGRTAAETIRSLFRYTFIWFHKIPEHIGLRRSYDTGVNVGTRAEIIEDTGRDRGVDEI